MNISLFQAADELAPLLDQIDEDGCISSELEEALKVFDGKALGVTAYILNCEANAQMIEDAANKMKERAKPLKNRAERLKQYLADNMKRTGMTSIVSPEFSVKLEIDRDESVDIFEPALLSSEYKKTPKPPEPSPDKIAIKKAIKEGKEVAGARIVTKDRLTIK
jgi:Siphovirus Gp157